MSTGFWIILAIIVAYLIVRFSLNKRFQSVPVDQLADWVRADGNRLVVDVREVQEYQGGHIPGSINVPLSGLTGHTGNIPKDKDVALICRSGNRSMQAARILKKNGYQRIWNVTRGMSGWNGQVEKGSKPGRLKA